MHRNTWPGFSVDPDTRHTVKVFGAAGQALQTIQVLLFFFFLNLNTVYVTDMAVLLADLLHNTPLLVIVIVDGRLRVVLLKIHMPKTTSSGVTPLFGNDMQIKTLSFTYIPSVHTFLAPGTKVLLQEIIIVKPPLPTMAYIYQSVPVAAEEEDNFNQE